jgi:phosphate:Na+ symporter
MIAGGLGMFLFGMKMLSDGLRSIAGNKMRLILERATSNRFFGVSVGALLTVVIQSSTAATVMIVGFVNAGLMNLTQAISLIMGAKIGTTFTAHIIAFRVDTFAPVLILIGFLLHLFAKRESGKNSGFIILSMGILFFGLAIMGGPLREFSYHPGFQSILTTFQNPILAILAGFIFTAIIQSSTAATGILVTMYLYGVNLPFSTAVFIILGINIGTTVTALLASIPARRESKRAALAYLIFITFGSVVFGTLIVIFPGILQWFQDTWHDGARQIAMFHTIFNAASTILILPFVTQLSKLLYFILPKRPDEKVNLEDSTDKNLELSQETAFVQAKSELVKMSRITLENLRLALEAFYYADREKAAVVMATESKIDRLDKKITSWLTQLQNITSPEDIETLRGMLNAVSNIERIGDHAENIAEYSSLQGIRRKDMHSGARDSLHLLSDKVLEIITMTVSLFENPDPEVIDQIDLLEEVIDDLAKECIDKYIEQQEFKVRDPRGGIVLTNIVGDLERCADHAVNIAHTMRTQQVIAQ